MPADMSKYPANWAEIRAAILRRAGGQEPDPRVGARCEFCGAENHKPNPATGARVILTVAHLDDPDPLNCDPANLAALCQRCHNRLDAPMRAANRAANMARKQRRRAIRGGQLKLF